ncbi:MAG: sodium:solute symporter [Saprospiraceae bacterium]|nr:sodium:solute symporter [Saprospiraceae bacterium]
MTQLTPSLIGMIIIGYFILLYLVSRMTGKKSDNATFFLAGRKTHWIWISIGMIGASLSGVTFISIPGVVGTDGLNGSFSYFQVVMGYMLGYAVIALILLPLYYRLNLTTIYGYLDKRFGSTSYKTGAAFFLISRIIGASFRLFLVAMVLDQFVLGLMGVPFWATVAISILLIWTYTQNSGMQTIIFTDVLQTAFMLLAVGLTIYFISQQMDISVWGALDKVRESDYSQVFHFEGGWTDPNNFFKQFLSGALITIVMTGLDQDMMQKNLACRSLRESQKNMFTFCLILVVANLMFLSMGALLYLYVDHAHIAIPVKSDQLYPMLALQYLPATVGIAFIVGLIAAAYSSADSALTALTTSFCVDFLGMEKTKKTETEQVKTRRKVHLAMSIILFLTIMGFAQLHDQAVITKLFEVAGYTYGPILGLFAFGLLTKRSVRDRLVLPLAIAAPLLTWVLNTWSDVLLAGFQLGFLLIAVNGLLMFFGLWLISTPPSSQNELVMQE